MATKSVRHRFTATEQGMTVVYYPQQLATGSSTVSRVVEQVKGEATNPFYKSQIAAHTQAGTSHSASDERVTVTPGYMSATWNDINVGAPGTPKPRQSCFVNRSGWFFNPSTTTVANPPGFSSSVANQALQSFNNRYGDATRQVMSGVIAGEAVQTIRMLMNPLKALRSGVHSYFDSLTKAKRKYRHKRDRRRALRDTWLEYSFGWVPLINDINDVGSYLMENHEKVGVYYTNISGHASAKTNGTASSYTQASYNSYLYFLFLTQTWKTQECWIKGQVAIKMGDPQFARGRLGLNLDDFLPTAWELIPYSFLVDYFTNVGSMIDVFSHGFKNLAWAVRSRKSTSNTLVSGMPDYARFNTLPKTGSGSRFQALGGSPGSLELTTTSFSRDIDGTYFLRPSLQFKLPHSSTKWLNIAALARRPKSLVPFY